MTSSIPSGRKAARFWTPLRTALTLMVFSLLAAFGVSSCNSQPGDVSRGNANANAPTVKMTVNSGNPSRPADAGTPGSDPANPTANLTPLPDPVLNEQFETLDGKAFKLSDLKGKVLVIDLWATWCGPCRYEVPHLVELQKEFGPRGFEVIGLDIDPENETPEEVQAFAKQFNINYKVAFAQRPIALALMNGNGSIPQSFVISRDGRIVTRFVGFNPSTTAPKLRQAIEQALNTKS